MSCAIRNARAFTLLELLLAATISVLLAGALLALTGNALELWRRARGDALMTAQAIQALDLLEADLQGAIVRSDFGPMFACDVLNSTAELQRHGWFTTGLRKPAGVESVRLPMETDLSDATACRFGLGGAWLRFVTTKADTHSDARRASAPTVVAYQLQRRATAHGARYDLCRSIVRPGASAGGAGGAFEGGYDVTAAPYATPSTVPGDAGTVTTPAAIDVLATDVVDFGVVIYARSESGALVREFPAAGLTSFRSGSRRPAVVDIVMRILTTEGALVLAAFERQPDTDARAESRSRWWEIVEAHSRVHVRRVELKQP